ncbi:hypothetical protein M0804_014381 [Polistes exclamans]|nr:hypothetical protein M0804_014381 [Polistes exclamans]
MFPALPVLVAGDFNAQSTRWDPEGRRNLRGQWLCAWANRMNLSLFNQPSVKYLGIVVDFRLSFRSHSEALIVKTGSILWSLERILPNLHGPREKKPRLYSSFVHSVFLYGAPV